MENKEIEQVIDLYGNSILRLAYSYLKNYDDAEDILQQTLINYVRSMPSFSEEKQRKSWLLTTAGNLSKNFIRDHKLNYRDELDESMLADKQKEDLSYIWNAVKSLPVKYREVIHLFYYEQYSTAEIAKILKCSEVSVRTNLKRGREKLKVILKQEYGDV